MTTDSYDGGHGGCLHERRLLVRNNWFHEIGRCQRFCVWFSNAPPWQEQMTEKKLLVERYVLQTNTNTDGRVESRDNEHRTMKKQMLHNFTESTKQTPTKTDVWSRADTSSAGTFLHERHP